MRVKYVKEGDVWYKIFYRKTYSIFTFDRNRSYRLGKVGEMH